MEKLRLLTKVITKMWYVNRVTCSEEKQDIDRKYLSLRMRMRHEACNNWPPNSLFCCERELTSSASWRKETTYYTGK